jgi:hypothetical protein
MSHFGEEGCSSLLIQVAVKRKQNGDRMKTETKVTNKNKYSSFYHTIF